MNGSAAEVLVLVAQRFDGDVKEAIQMVAKALVEASEGNLGLLTKLIDIEKDASLSRKFRNPAAFASVN